ncbi:TldD/PmbA family protein [Alkaliphilus serpentinus]|uniref:TldD/PmbA family protein n=1 Tax=Alkaliphilus serpentinus TaxID=1482731 RepID=A0A833MBA1_9FIRM|nr:metallopeptidase TldD-related protein [Alkaliphilus serpentinus]KAB3532829.1 TldD/PmbA family protein [Alkaliphilus serpentinus]
MENLFKKVLEKCDGAELYKKDEYKTQLTILNGSIQSVKGHKTLGISLRINKDGRSGSAVATSLEDESIIDRAILSSKYQKEETLTFKNLPVEEVKCYDKKVADLTIDEIKNEGLRILDLFKSVNAEVIPDVYIYRTIEYLHIVNSAGFDNQYKKTGYYILLMTKSKQGFIAVTHRVKAAKFIELSLDDVKLIIEKHLATENRVQVATGSYPVIFSGSAMGALMTRLLSGVNAGNVLKNISPLENKLGEKIASDIITIRDNGRLEYGFGSCPFDDEGTPTKDTYLIEKGILKSYLVAASAEEKLKMKATGNSFKRTIFSNDIEDQPSIDSSNFVIEGANPLPDAELIKGIKKGIYVDAVMGTHTGNIPAGEYSLNVSAGYLIEDGKFVGKVMDVMVAGNIYEDMLKIKEVATKPEVMNVVFFTMGYSPAVLFDGISVVGS